MPFAIETFALTKRFPVSRGWRGLLSSGPAGNLAVDCVDLAIGQGELFGLVGPNGAGKTTLIKLLCTLIVPTSGTARVNGYDLEHEAAIKRSIGLVTSDERSFYWRLTGRQNLTFFATLQGLPSRGVHRRVEEVLTQVELQEVADVRFQFYSSGMRQRLSVARALLNEPRVLFLDEPTKGLDPTATRRLHQLIRDQLVSQHGATVFLTTHRLEEAEQVCDRVAIMDRGRIRACGTLSELRTLLGLAERYRLQVRGFGPAMRTSLQQRVTGLRVTNLDGHEALLELEALDDEVLNDVIDIVREGGGRIRTLSREPVSLDAIFTHVTRQGSDETREQARRDSGVPGKATQRRPATSPELPPAPGRTGGLARGARQRPGALETGLRVAVAFIRRDLRSELSYRFSFLLQFFGIFFSVVMFYFVARLLGEAASPYLAPYGGDYFAFVLIGIALAGYFGVGLSSFSTSLRRAQTTGTLEAMLTTSTGISTIILCSSLWSYLMTTFRVLLYLAVGVLFLGLNLTQGNYPVALLILALTVVSFSSLGIIAASFVMIAKRGDPVTWVFSSLSSLLGGVYYPITILPAWLQPISRLLPITYALDGMRLALLQGASLVTVLPDVLALVLFGLLLLPLSLLAFRHAVQRARVDGSLTHY